MSLRDVLRRVLRPASTPGAATSTVSGFDERAWAAAAESGRLTPPQDVHDAAAWDTYWTNQLEFGPVDVGFADMMSDDDQLVGLLAGRNVRTILCAGNGLSTEALSLALHGFQVITLDLSRVPAERIVAALGHPEHPAVRIPGFRVTNDSIVFGEPGPLAAELCPKIHRTAGHAPRAGGTLGFVTGDLMAPELCPGPFDAVIERRTVQLFPKEERPLALTRLVSRLDERGMFVSHHHDGRGRPGTAEHYATDWVTSSGFVLDYAVDIVTRRSVPRLACLRLSTG